MKLLVVDDDTNLVDALVQSFTLEWPDCQVLTAGPLRGDRYRHLGEPLGQRASSTRPPATAHLLLSCPRAARSRRIPACPTRSA